MAINMLVIHIYIDSSHHQRICLCGFAAECCGFEAEIVTYPLVVASLKYDFMIYIAF